ncbi:YggS family pyridoxal phosphate-dependent enzyme [Schaalia sp. 19OD2882]|uniref:YggS family pyridoxal phosphate-dependent enzyme n=1 Tax=Schaalia sp. 19OD2882 TaxID=2794089 RepID=UPI001C1EB768|nr:YggS family pyridoxal phosphate-dependent enzyme [Schaalia sp. 19OD2882]QWW19107.1 YggS family pyridoxal phosphate-dependent enzyme [Schaalia sp. 19OD2882]
MGVWENIEAARVRIDQAAQAASRSDRVDLQVAVKTQSPERCAEAAAALGALGLPVLLGHNRVQEAQATIVAIRSVAGARVHLIGPLQSNKVNQALACVDAIDTVDRVDLVQRLATRVRAAHDPNCPALPVLVQVNVSQEDTKSGCLVREAPALVDAILSTPTLRLAGFMTVGLNSHEEAPVRRAYATLRNLRDDTARRLGMDQAALALSMGMSGDIEWAIAEGATVVRLGTAIFGPRT